MDELEVFKQELEDLKSLRNRLAGVDNAPELDDNDADIRVYLKDEVELIDKEIKAIEEISKKKHDKYKEYYDAIKKVHEENERKLEETKLLSNEEVYELRDYSDDQIAEINKKSQKEQKEYEECEKTIIQLKKDRTKISNRIKLTEALNLTYNEYKEIYATIKNREIMDKIYAAKGLASIIEKSPAERTREEKEILKQAKNEAMTEIGAFRKENYEYSIKESIDKIYSVNPTVPRSDDQKPEIYPMKQEEINNSKSNIDEFSPVIKDGNTVIKGDITDEIPKDMENATSNVKVDLSTLKSPVEKITLFKDENTDDFYVRRYAADRFKLKSVDSTKEVRINGSICYKISEQDVNKIKENANNAFSPYITDIKEVHIEKEKAEYGIAPEDTKDELIPGTNIKRPRDRGIDESDKDYTAFLERYYNAVFPKEAEDAIVPNTEEKALRVIPQPEEKALRVIPQPEEKEELEEYDYVEEKKEEPIEIELPDNGFVIDFTEEKKELTKEEIKEVVEESFDNKEELTQDGIKDVVEDSFNEELTKEDVKDVVEDSFNEELTKEDVKDVVEDSFNNEEEKESSDSIDNEDESEEEKETLGDDEEDRVSDDERLKNVWYYATAVKASDDFKDELKHGGVFYNIVHKIVKKIKSYYRPYYTDNDSNKPKTK